MHWVAACQSRTGTSEASAEVRTETTARESSWATLPCNGETLMAKPLPRIDGTETVRELRPVEQKIEQPAPPEENYVTSMAHVRRVDVVLPPRHRKILSDKIRKLQDEGARLDDGTEVTDKTKAVLWILENEVTV